MRAVIRTFVAAVLALTLIWGTWSGVLTQVDQMNPADGRILMLGRVHRDGPHRLRFDDGTGVTTLHWQGPPQARPSAGMLIFLRAEAVSDRGTDAAHPYVLHGYARWRIADETKHDVLLAE